MTLCAAMEHALVMDNNHRKIFKQGYSLLCCLCQRKDETIQHIIGGCGKLAGNKYMNMHTEVAWYVYWNMLK
eukprot:14137902-Ditylum_brightwellii.AAC.1